MAHFSLFGGHGFVGRAVQRQLVARGLPFRVVGRGQWPQPGADLGHVIFAVGMTADFRNRLMETAELQVVRCYEALTQYRFKSFLYLSSTRVYQGARATDEETPLVVQPISTDHIYNISKIAGESLCLSHPDPCVRVVRLSNVFGPDDTSNLFLTAVVREAVQRGVVQIGQSPASEKDYVPVEFAAGLLVDIALGGRARLYNVASGRNISHRAIADVLERAGFPVLFTDGGPVVTFPPIVTHRAAAEFAATAPDFAESLHVAIAAAKSRLHKV